MGLFGSSFNQADPSGYLMNIGGRQQPQNPWAMAMQPTQQQAAQQFQQQYGYQTPGIGDEVRGTQPIGNMQPQQLPTDPRAAQAARPGFFGKGGRGWGILGVIGDGLQVAGGGRATYQDHMQQQQEYAQRLQELQAERQARMQERQQSAEQGFETWKQQQQWARDNPDPTTLQQNVDYAYSLPEGDPRREAAIRGVQGYGYSPEVMDQRLQQQQELINARAAAQRSVKMTVPGKAASAGGGGHGAKKTINGMTFYNVGGKWFDNPEGR